MTESDPRNKAAPDDELKVLRERLEEARFLLSAKKMQDEGYRKEVDKCLVLAIAALASRLAVTGQPRDPRQFSPTTGSVKTWLCKDWAGEWYLTRSTIDSCTAVEDGRYCVEITDSPPQPAAVLRGTLREFADAVERVAFSMPPPNEYTPRFVQMAQSARRLALPSPPQPEQQQHSGGRDRPVAESGVGRGHRSLGAKPEERG